MGRLDGYKIIPVDLGKLLSLVHFEQARGTEYVYGGKPDPIGASPAIYRKNGNTVAGVDCSGFHMYCMWHAAFGSPFIVPDGSTAQNDFYGNRGFKHHAVTEPGDYTVNLSPDVLYVAFCRAGSRGEAIGHVWFVYFDIHAHQWMTVESHGGHGPNVRPATTPVLTRICTDVYAICEVHN